MSERKPKIEEAIKQHAATFIEREAERTSLITVTHADVSPDFKHSTIFISVLPDAQAENALNFCKRKMGDFKHYVKTHMNMKSIPFFDVELDRGEMNRQRIEDISAGL